MRQHLLESYWDFWPSLSSVVEERGCLPSEAVLLSVTSRLVLGNNYNKNNKHAYTGKPVIVLHI
jgi:hypothetical protein